MGDVRVIVALLLAIPAVAAAGCTGGTCAELGDDAIAARCGGEPADCGPRPLGTCDDVCSDACVGPRMTCTPGGWRDTHEGCRCAGVGGGPETTMVWRWRQEVTGNCPHVAPRTDVVARVTRTREARLSFVTGTELSMQFVGIGLNPCTIWIDGDFTDVWVTDDGTPVPVLADFSVRLTGAEAWDPYGLHGSFTATAPGCELTGTMEGTYEPSPALGPT
jgi:hypothetical protein